MILHLCSSYLPRGVGRPVPSAYRSPAPPCRFLQFETSETLSHGVSRDGTLTAAILQTFPSFALKSFKETIDWPVLYPALFFFTLPKRKLQPTVWSNANNIWQNIKKNVQTKDKKEFLSSRSFYLQGHQFKAINWLSSSASIHISLLQNSSHTFSRFLACSSEICPQSSVKVCTQ